ncbi:MAG: hypothetical protein E7258_05065 [Lachnospiraceae bacterium]|nr:hypothetical protein [Lachnospiraceae bacterium]
MATLPEFQVIAQDKVSIPPWAKYMSKDEFISYGPTFNAKAYFHLFDYYEYLCEKAGTIRYYVYDPIKHGASPDGVYPVLMWLHGASNSMDGVKCIMCCGAEQFATPSYQEKMGGAFIIVPLCNETRGESGEILGAWNTYDETGKTSIYTQAVKGIYDKVCEEHKGNIGKRFVMGASSGGYMTWQLLADYPDYFSGAMPISAVHHIDEELLSVLNEKNVQLLICHGRYDEMADYKKYIEPYEDTLSQYNNISCYFPKWVKNGDGGISSICYGFEMGQHCMINQIQANLMFDDGTPMDEKFPEGVTGWIKSNK